jgi:hypothetical protein
MRLLARLFVILFACVIASLAAGVVITLAVLLPQWGALDFDPIDGDVFRVVVGFGTIFVSVFAFLPALAMIAIAEAAGIRSLLYYACSGALIAAFLYYDFRGWDVLALPLEDSARRELEIIAAAGIVAGLVYWAIAGRSAGLRQRASVPPDNVT